MTGSELEVLDLVVLLVAVDVMDGFFCPQRASEMSCHHKPVFQ